MDSSTAELYNMDEIKDALRDPVVRDKFREKDLIPIKEIVTPDEVAQGYASFETWAKALGLQLHTRQLKRNAERRYKKALKKKDKE